MNKAAPRKTYAEIDNLSFRIRAASSLLGVTDNTLRTYSTNSGIDIPRADSGVPVRIFNAPSLFEMARWRREQGYLKAPEQSDAGPVVITVDIVKSDTGKTTTTVETATHLQLLGLRVLAIDLDTQANLTQAFGYEDDIDMSEIEQYGFAPEAVITQTFGDAVLRFFDNKRLGKPIQPMTDLIKMPFGPFGPHIIGADTNLADLEIGIANSNGPRELAIRSLFEAANAGEIPGLNLRDYDVVLLDCPSSVSWTSPSALAAADLVIAPVRMDAFTVKGLIRLMGEIASIEECYRWKPELVILPTHYSPQFSRISRMQIKLNQYSEMLAPSSISASEEFPKGLENYLPLAMQRPTCQATKEYQLFAQFIRGKILAIAAAKAKKGK